MLKWAAAQKQNTIMCICLCAHYAKEEKPRFFLKYESQLFKTG